MTPGTSALVLLSADAVIGTVAKAFEGHAMELMRSDLSVQQEDRLRAAFSDPADARGPAAGQRPRGQALTSSGCYRPAGLWPQSRRAGHKLAVGSTLTVSAVGCRVTDVCRGIDDGRAGSHRCARRAGVRDNGRMPIGEPCACAVRRRRRGSVHR
jgi:hypothetical protein